MKFISPLTWPGGKAKHFNKIKQFLPKEIDIFIEPFCGGASVGLNVLNQNLCTKAIFNDLHTELIDFWQQGIHLIELDALQKLAYPNLKTIDELQQKITNDYRLNQGEKFLMKNALSFNGMEWGKWTDLRLKQNFNNNKLIRIKNVRKLLVNPKYKIEFCNLDYKDIIKLYDTSDVVWYFDPPYFYNQGKVYKHKKMDFMEFKTQLSQIKGKWILSIDNSKYIRDLFKEFNIHEFEWKYTTSNAHNCKPRLGKELIITNFTNDDNND